MDANVLYISRAEGKKMLNLLMQEPIFERAAQKYLTAAALRHVQRMADTMKKTVIWL